MNGEEEAAIPTDESITPPVFDDGSEQEVEGDDSGDGTDDISEGSSDSSESYGPEPLIGGPTRRNRRQKKHYKTPGYVPVPQGKTREPLPWEDRNLEWDGWCNSFAWGKDPTLKFVLKRLAPERGPNGQAISGVLETRESTPCLLEEVRGTYGGGDYEAAIIGLHPLTQDNKPRVLARRRTRLPGPPNAMDGALPRGILSTRGGAGDPLARTAMDMLKTEVESLRRNRDDSPRLVEKTISTVQAVSEQRAKFAEQSADARIELVNKQLEEARQHNKELSDRLRSTESEMMRKAVESQEKVAVAVQEAQTGSMSILTQLLPTLTGGASEQVKQMATLYQVREERQASEYKAIIQQMQANFQSQMESRQTLFLAQLETTKGQYESTIGLLRQELQSARADATSLQRRLEELRTTLDAKNQELITHALNGKGNRSAVEQMTELGTMFEAMESMKSFLGGGAPADDLEGVDNPVTRKLLKIGEGAVQHLPAFLQAFKPGGPQPQPPMVPPQQSMMQPMMPPQRPTMTPRLPSQPRPVSVPSAAPAAPAAPPIHKKDVITALQFIENVVTAGGDTPTPAESVAMAAIAQADNNVLRALSSRKPESVIAQLESQDMLRGVLKEERGKKYLVELLIALRKQFE